MNAVVLPILAILWIGVDNESQEANVARELNISYKSAHKI